MPARLFVPSTLKVFEDSVGIKLDIPWDPLRTLSNRGEALVLRTFDPGRRCSLCERVDSRRTHWVLGFADGVHFVRSLMPRFGGEISEVNGLRSYWE